MDCYFAKITDVQHHPNADRLDIGMVNNWQVIVARGEWNDGDEGLFICPDAMLDMTQDWCQEYGTYLGKNDRVRTVKLQQLYSNGIFVKKDYLLSKFLDVGIDKMGPEELAATLGIKHYEKPVKPFNPNSKGDLCVLYNELPMGLQKTDEENWENLWERDLHLGEEALVTRKMDGKSATYIATPEGELLCCSRNLTYKTEMDNDYTLPGRDIVGPAILKYAKEHNKTIVVRGELTGAGIQNMGVNKDCKGPRKFNLFKCMFPDEEEYAVRNGLWGTWAHFTEVNKELGLDQVDVLGVETISIDLLRKYQAAPKEDGEGVVLNHKAGSFKAKSAEYYSRIK